MRTLTDGPTTIMCLIDQEPVPNHLASCNKFKRVRRLADFRQFAAWAFHPASYRRPQALSEPEEPSSPAPRAGDGGGNSAGAAPAEERRIITGDGDIILPSVRRQRTCGPSCLLRGADRSGAIQSLSRRSRCRREQAPHREDPRRPQGEGAAARGAGEPAEAAEAADAGEADLRTETTAETGASPLAQPLTFAPSCGQLSTVLGQSRTSPPGGASRRP